MKNLIALDDYGITEKKGLPVVSSRKVSEIFLKDHDNVLRDIRNLECSMEFSLLNFEERNYKNRGKAYPEFLMTKDGFIFLVMGYRGKKAAQFKEIYIRRFNEMEEFIKSLTTAKMEFPAFTNAIMMAHDEPKHYHFSNELNMINSIVLGMTTKKFKKIKGIEKVPSIRPYLTLEEIKSIEGLQRVDIGLIIAIPDYQERKRILQDYFDKFKIRLLTA